jgi:hypothetical protein
MSVAQSKNCENFRPPREPAILAGGGKGGARSDGAYGQGAYQTDPGAPYPVVPGGAPPPADPGAYESPPVPTETPDVEPAPAEPPPIPQDTGDAGAAGQDGLGQ